MENQVYKLYGIKNCQTVKKAMIYLEERKIPFTFVDFKTTPPSEDTILRWKSFCQDFPTNKKGLTYRKLKDEYESLSDADKISFMRTYSSLIKRPILEKNDVTLFLGFDHAQYDQLVQ